MKFFGAPFYRQEMERRFIYFGLFALWALKFHLFVGRLITNKHLPITDNCLKNEQKRY